MYASLYFYGSLNLCFLSSGQHFLQCFFLFSAVNELKAVVCFIEKTTSCLHFSTKVLHSLE